MAATVSKDHLTALATVECSADSFPNILSKAQKDTHLYQGLTSQQYYTRILGPIESVLDGENERFVRYKPTYFDFTLVPPYLIVAGHHILNSNTKTGIVVLYCDCENGNSAYNEKVITRYS
jgi:hypothetical protein